MSESAEKPKAEQERSSGKLRTVPVESWGKHELQIEINGEWRYLHSDYMCRIEPMEKLIERAIADAAQEAGISAAMLRDGRAAAFGDLLAACKQAFDFVEEHSKAGLMHKAGLHKILSEAIAKATNVGEEPTNAAAS